MTIRASAKLLLLSCTVALASLGAAEPGSDFSASARTPLTRQDKSGHPPPEGEGGELSPLTPRVQADFDSWRGHFNSQLDESLARLQTEDEQTQREVVAVTWGGPSVNPGRTSMPVSSVVPEQDDQAGMIARLLRQHGLPSALTSVVAVESAFNPLALSPKGARGLWQLMPATARRYGLTVAPHLDERIDPVESTRAAAAYMKDLFAQFQDWPLALAAYNAGEDRVARAMVRTGARDFWTLRRHAALPDETLRYVPAILTRLEEPLDARESQNSIFASDHPVGKNGPTEGRVVYASPAAE